jgi:hypothetical protein
VINRQHVQGRDLNCAAPLQENVERGEVGATDQVCKYKHIVLNQ